MDQKTSTAFILVERSIESLRTDDPVERLIDSVEIHTKLLDLISQCARVRRTHIRALRAEGWTARAIGEAVGISTQRVYQLESGADRKEKG
jgi:DNA-directed RNA polymerase sigma subunit (sigma70/sigma32)